MLSASLERLVCLRSKLRALSAAGASTTTSLTNRAPTGRDWASRQSTAKPRCVDPVRHFAHGMVKQSANPPQCMALPLGGQTVMCFRPGANHDRGRAVTTGLLHPSPITPQGALRRSIRRSLRRGLRRSLRRSRTLATQSVRILALAGL